MSSLAAEAAKRKERLLKLKQVAEATSNKEANIDKKRPADTGDALRFRAYNPEAESLLKFKQPEPSVGPKANLDQDTVENRAHEIKKEAEKEEQRLGGELDLTNLAPKKRNWDLKRDLENKMEKLDRMTKIAMADLIRTYLF